MRDGSDKLRPGSYQIPSKADNPGDQPEKGYESASADNGRGAMKSFNDSVNETPKNQFTAAARLILGDEVASV